MRQQYKKIVFWFLTLIAVTTCTFQELDPFGRNIRSKSLRLQRSRLSDPPGSELTRSTSTYISHPISSQQCSSDISDKISIALHTANISAVSMNITSEQMKQRLNDTHFENLPYARNADSSTRNTIKELYALKEHWDKINISPSDEGDLSTDLRNLMCSMVCAAKIKDSIMVAFPLITDAEFSRSMSSHCTRERNYIVMKDIVSYLEGLRNETCVP